MRAGETDVGARDRGHPDKVVRAGEESGEAGGERDPVAHAHPHGRRDHLLLGDEHLEVAVGVFLCELLGLGGVAHLAVEGDNVFPGAAKRLEGSPVGAAGCLFVPDLPGRKVQFAGEARGEVLAWSGSGLRTSTSRSSTSPSSSRAFWTSSPGTGLPCMPSMSSRKDTP